MTKNIVHHLRLLLLSPEELKIVESDNEKDLLIPVSRPEISLSIDQVICESAGLSVASRSVSLAIACGKNEEFTKIRIN